MRYTTLAVAAFFILIAAACTRIDQAPTPTESTSAIPTETTGVPATPVTSPTATATPAPTPHVPIDRIATIPWVADGLTVQERFAADALHTIADASEAAFWELIGKSWLSDQLVLEERLALYELRDIANSYGPHATDVLRHIVVMPFMETIEDDDFSALSTIAMMAEGGPEIAAQQILSREPRVNITDEMTRGVVVRYMDPAVAEFIRGMSWFQDDVAYRAEDLHAVHFYLIARESPELFDELAAKPWIGETDIASQQIISLFAELSAKRSSDPVSALTIARMTTMEKGGTEAQVVLEELVRIHRREDGWLAKVLAHPGIESDVSVDNLGKVIIADLEFESPTLAHALWDYGWAIDAVTTEETHLISILRLARPDFPELDFIVIDKGWIQGEISRNHTRFLKTIVQMKEENNPLLETIFEIPWLNADIESGVDGAVRGLIQSSELGEEAVDIILAVANEAKDERTARWAVRSLGLANWPQIEDLVNVTSLPWVKDGVSGEEAGILWEMGVIPRAVPQYLDVTLSLEWIRDDISPREGYALGALVSIAIVSQHISVQGEDYANAYGALINKQWVRDGMNQAEIDAVVKLRRVGFYADGEGDELLRRLLAMPFLAQIQGTELQLLQELSRLLSDDDQRDPVIDLFINSPDIPQIDDGFNADDLHALLE